jgi:hypothetical protein
MVVKLTPDFIAINPACPEGKRRVEFVGTGLCQGICGVTERMAKDYSGG